MTRTEAPGLSLEDRRAIGEEAAAQTPLSSQAEAPPTDGRPDPVELLIEQNVTREARPGASTARPDDGLAVHVLSWARRR